MSKLLFVNACVRPESRTLILAQYVIERLGKKEKEELNLYQEQVNSLDLGKLHFREKAVLSGEYSANDFSRARQFAAADVVVIAAPYWDLSFPAVLKQYIEEISVAGITFKYTDEGYPAGLCRARRLIYVTTAGGEIADRNFGFDYIRAIAGMLYGIPEIYCVSAQKLDVAGADIRRILEEAMHQADDIFSLH